MRSVWKYVCIVIIIISLPTGASPQDNNYFYQRLEYGSESVFSPFSMILNNMYGIMAASNRSNDITDIEYATALENIVDNISHPFKHIDRYGWGEFIKSELVPSSLELKNAQFWPNYTNHVMGGGMLFRRTESMYAAKNLPHPRISAILTIETMHLLNEMVENSGFTGTNVDPIADLLLFDNLGILLFSSDRIARFFDETLNMKDWSLQPMIDPSSMKIQNAAQNYMIRHKIPWRDNVSLFYFWGNNGIFGTSFNLENEYNLSVGGGLTMKDLVEYGDNGIRKVSSDLIWTYGIFYDRNGSLLSSLILSGTKRYKALFNLYPGTFKIGKIKPGLFAALDKDNTFYAGLRISVFPVGLTNSK